MDTADLYNALLYKIKPRDDLKKKSYVKDLGDEVEYSIFPNEEKHKIPINQDKFNEIYGYCEELVSENESILKLWKYLKEISEMCFSVMNLCLEKM